MEQSERNEQEPEIVQSDNPDLKPSGSVTFDQESKKMVGGWYIDDEGFYLSPPNRMDNETWEHYKDLHRSGAFRRKKRQENPNIN